MFGNEKVRTSDEETTVPDVGKSSFFGRHFKAIAAMAVGGAMALVGTALIIVGIATR